MSDYRFGVDLGTTNSAVARSNGVEIRSYQNNDQMNVTPSAVRILKSGRLFVGRKAHNAVVDDPENVATEFKRLMGQKVSKSFPASGRVMSPEELSAEVLKSLKEDVRRQTGEEVRQAVITVPAAFVTLQCEATSRAANLAGIDDTYLLQEPIAASVAYGIQPGAWGQHWLIFDLGGGTLDTAVVSTRNGRLTVLEHKGDNFLGGKDMDRLLVERLLLPALEGQFELPDTGSPERVSLLRRLLTRAEEAKIDLSSSEQVVVTIVDVGTDRCGKQIEAEILLRRADLEQVIDPLVRACLQLAQDAVSGARVSCSDLDRVLLVGGPTQIPYVRAALAESLGAKLDFSIDPMTVVACGAAVFAASVEWANNSTISASRSVGEANLELGYHRVSSDLQPSVAGRLLSADRIDAIRIDADGGFWTSGWIRPADGGFDTQVRLVEGKLTQFWLYARRQDGALVDLNPNSFSIRHGLVPALPPLPHSIGIEIVKSGGKAEVDWIFRKGESLPLKREVRYRAAHDLRQPDGSLAIKIWEGETQEDPEANSWSGALKISARQIAPLAIRQGTEICLTVAIDESRRITVDAFVPNIQRTFSDGIYLPERDQQSPDAQFEETVGAIEPLVERLAAVRRAASERDDSSASLAADRLADKLEEISMVDAAAGSDDPDSASRSLQDVKKIRIDLARLEQQTGVGELLTTDAEQVKRTAGPIREITEKYGADLDKRQLGMLIRDLDRAEGRGDNRTVRRVAEDLQSLKWRVLFTQDWFWKEALEAQQQPGCKFLRQDEASKWLEKGGEAVRKGDSLSLQEAVKHLWELQPKPEVQLDKERALQAGLRRF